MNIRSTTLGTNNTMLNYLSNTETKYYDLLEQSASGLKVAKPSDNPTSTRSILNINTKLTQLDSYKENMSTTQTELDTLDSSLSSVTGLIQDSSDLVTQAANGTYNQNDLNNIKTQIDSILASVKDLANTQYNGQYIFSGTATSTPAYATDASGNISYQGADTSGNDYKRYVTISDGVSVAINAPGDKVFGSYSTTTAAPTPTVPGDVAGTTTTTATDANGIETTTSVTVVLNSNGTTTRTTNTGTGIIGTLQLLSNALGSGNKADIKGSLDKLDSCLDTTSATRTKFASVSNRFEMTQNSIDTTTTNLKSQKSSLEDIDLTQVLTDLAAQKSALQATMSVTSNLLSGKSLLDYM